MMPDHPRGTGGGPTLFWMLLILLMGLLGLELLEGLYRVGKAVWRP